MAIEYKLPYTASEIEEKLGQINNKLDVSALNPAIEIALTEAKASGEFDGADGLTPYINNAGNWQIGEKDTGVKAEGEDGYTPVKGLDYFTEAEIQDVVDRVLSEIPASEETAF